MPLFEFQDTFPRDRELTEAELREANVVFWRLFSGIVRDPRASIPSNWLGLPPAAHLDLTSQPQRTRVYADDDPRKLSDGVVREVSVSLADRLAQANIGTSFYREGIDGVVRRFDAAGLTAAERDKDIDPDGSITTRELRSRIDAEVDMIAHRIGEIVQGNNGQPVTAVELGKLATFLGVEIDRPAGA